MNHVRRFDQELADLKQLLVSMGDLVEAALTIGVDAILKPMAGVRATAGELEERIDQLDIQIEERCHSLMVLQSPMASDLRFLISATRITSDLEQAADLAESVAKRADYIARHHAVENPEHLAPLGELTRTMLRQALEALITGRFDEANGILIEEDQADRLTKHCYAAIQHAMQREPEFIAEYTHLLRAASKLEQIADIAVAIAEQAVYIHRGHLVMHPKEDVLEA
jgi:phosphate transport system protein